MLNKGIGMGYAEVDHAAIGTEIFIGIRNKRISAEVVRPPFFKAPA